MNEVVCYPVDKTYWQVEAFGIYCRHPYRKAKGGEIQEDKTPQETIFFLPRMSYLHDIKQSYLDSKVTIMPEIESKLNEPLQPKGDHRRGAFWCIYRIKNIYHDHRKIKDKELRKKVRLWIQMDSIIHKNDTKDKIFEVIELGERIDFNIPLYTRNSHNPYKRYYCDLNELFEVE